MPAENKPPLERFAFFDIDGTLSEKAVFFPWVKDQVRKKKIDSGCLPAFEDLEEEFTLLQSTSESEIKIPRTTYGEGTDGYEIELWNPEEAAVSRYESLVFATLSLHAHVLKGKTVKEIQDHANQFFSQAKLWRPWAMPTINILKDKYGYEPIIATALPDIAAIAVASYFGVRKQFGTIYTTELLKGEPVFSGELGPNLVFASRRSAVAIEQIRQIPHSSPGASVLAFDDSIAGVGMLYFANRFGGAFGVAPSPELRRECNRYGWKVIPNEPELDRNQMPLVLRKHLDDSPPPRPFLRPD